MAFRALVIDSHSKLEYSLGYLIFRTPQATKRLLLDEIHTIIINSTAVSITSSLLVELTKRKIKIIFCDEKHDPCSELIPCYGNNITSKRIKMQISWTKDTADKCWMSIVRKKILNQAKLLKSSNMVNEANMLLEYASEIEPGDPTNREGHAAKVYFNSVFSPGFTREKDCFINAALNYGYAIVLSEINRAVVSSGYLTQLGIHHKNEFNEFNLSSDLIEPFRYFVDKKAKALKEDANFKAEMINLLSEEVLISGKTQTLVNAINLYVNSFFDAMENDNPNKITFADD